MINFRHCTVLFKLIGTILDFLRRINELRKQKIEKSKLKGKCEKGKTAERRGNVRRTRGRRRKLRKERKRKKKLRTERGRRGNVNIVRGRRGKIRKGRK